MSKSDLQNWIKENLVYSRGLICKKCKKLWFESYNHLDIWNSIENHTSFLNNYSPTFPQRIWHIINGINMVKCSNPDCNNPPTFFSFTKGYLSACSNRCAQFNPITISKIKSTNLKKYGVEYALSNSDVISKKNATVINKYGVDNVSKLSGVSEKKQITCLRNYGSKWFLERQDLKEKIIKNKYSVKNVQMVEDISVKTIHTKRGNFYNSLFTSDRLKNKCIPLFTKKHYIETGIESKHVFECTNCKTPFLGWLHDGDIPRCPTCYPTIGNSLFESEITNYVKQLLGDSIEVKENTKSVLNNNLELDIYIPSKNLAIECNGLFWHSEFGGNKSRNYHLNKTVECENKNIHLIHIFEDEWRDKQEIVKNKLRHILKLNDTNVVYARKCKLVDNVPTSYKKMFMENNHIQGNDNSIIRIGLSHNDIMVAMMTFSNKRVFIGYKNKNNKDEYELSRYTTLNSHNVIGGASKLISYFIKYYKPSKIISYADRRWTKSSINLYEKIGFKKVTNGTPNYWYFGQSPNYKRIHRFGFRKDILHKRLKLFDSNLSEWENMKLNGYDRIWDCGNLKYEMVF